MDDLDRIAGPWIDPGAKHLAGFRVLVEQDLPTHLLEAGISILIAQGTALADVHALDLEQQAIRLTGYAAVGPPVPPVGNRLGVFHGALDLSHRDQRSLGRAEVQGRRGSRERQRAAEQNQ